MKMKFFSLAMASALCWQFACGQTVDSKVVEDGGSGPYKAFVASERALADYAIYRPQDLKGTVEKVGKLPVIVYGNGGCRNSSVEFEKFLSEIASHGYVIVAIGPLSRKSVEETNSVMGGMTTADLLNKAIDLITEQANKAGSEYYNMLDLEHIAAMGQSCGGLQALTASVDSRVKTTLVLNSGIFKSGGMAMPDLSKINMDSLVATLPDAIKDMLLDENGKMKDLSELMPTGGMAGGMTDGNGLGGSMGKDGLKQLHAPIVYIIGGPDDIAFENATDDYQLINHLPVAIANLPVGHLGTYQDVHGGQFSVIAMKWLDWQLKGKSGESAFFLDKDYVAKNYPEWSVEHKNF